jgi:hypothetical protein
MFYGQHAKYFRNSRVTLIVQYKFWGINHSLRSILFSPRSVRHVAARNKSRLGHIFETRKELKSEYQTRTKKIRSGLVKQRKHIY